MSELKKTITWYEYQKMKHDAGQKTSYELKNFSKNSIVNLLTKNKTENFSVTGDKLKNAMTATALALSVAGLVTGTVKAIGNMKRAWDHNVRNFKVKVDRYYILEVDPIRREKLRLVGDLNGYASQLLALNWIKQNGGVGFDLFIKKGSELTDQYGSYYKRFTQVDEPGIGKINVVEFQEK